MIRPAIDGAVVQNARCNRSGGTFGVGPKTWIILILLYIIVDLNSVGGSGYIPMCRPR